MENIGTGHWIFAGVFLLAYIIYLVWSYRKDLKLHKIHYPGASLIIGGIIVAIFLIYVIKVLVN